MPITELGLTPSVTKPAAKPKTREWRNIDVDLCVSHDPTTQGPPYAIRYKHIRESSVCDNLGIAYRSENNPLVTYAPSSDSVRQSS